MKDLLIFGAVGVGGYLLYSHFASQQNSLITAISTSNANSNNIAGAVSNQYLVTSQKQSELQSYYTRRWNTLNNPTFSGWMYVFNQLYGYPLPQVLNNIGIDANASYTVGDFASVVNHALTIGNAVGSPGLGMLAIAGTQGYGLQNHRLPASLELYNALLH